MDESEFRKPRDWSAKFGDAFRGFKRGIRGESSFFAHFFAAAVVLTVGIALQPSRWEWCLLVLCVTIVLSAEMFNSCIERLAKAVDKNHNPTLGEALDIASAAVLIAALGAAAVGLLIFGPPLLEMFAHLP